MKVGFCECGELYFAFVFLFAAWPSYEGGEKLRGEPKVLVSSQDLWGKDYRVRKRLSH
jgi:hypothetical protein